MAPATSTDAPHPERSRGLAALVAVQLLFGLHYSVAREITATLDPIAWTVLRVVGGALLLAGVLYLRKIPWPSGHGRWIRLSALGICGIAVNQLLFNAGISRSTAIHGVLVMATLPAQTLLLALLRRDERLRARDLAAVALGGLGIIALLGVDRALSAPEAWLRTRDGGPAASFGESVLAGDLMMLGNAHAYALFLVFGRRSAAELDPLAMTAALYVAGALFVLAIGGGALVNVDLAAIPPRIWGLGAFVIVGPTVLAYLLNVYALRRLPSSLVGLFIYLQFVIAAATGAAWHGEEIDARVAIAALLVLGGLGLRLLPGLRRRPRR